MMREEEEAERMSDLAMELDRQRAVATYEVGACTRGDGHLYFTSFL